MLTAKNIAILVNSTSGKGRAIKFLNLVSFFLNEHNISHSVFIDQWKFNENDFTEIWIIGGDGTLNYFINLFPNIKTPLVILKGGTGNDIAWKLYGDISFEEQLHLVINSTAKYIDAARCNDKLFINGVGIGFDGEVLESMKTVRLIGGHLGYLLIVLKKIFTFKEYRFKIIADNIETDDEYLLVMINNSSRTGGGFHVSPLAEINDGLLNVVLCKKLSLPQRLKYLPIIEKGKHLALPVMKHFTTKNIIIECDHELPAHLDGELIRSKKFDIEILKNQFLFKY